MSPARPHITLRTFIAALLLLTNAAPVILSGCADMSSMRSGSDSRHAWMPVAASTGPMDMGGAACMTMSCCTRDPNPIQHPSSAAPDFMADSPCSHCVIEGTETGTLFVRADQERHSVHTGDSAASGMVTAVSAPAVPSLFSGSGVSIPAQGLTAPDRGPSLVILHGAFLI